MDHELSSMICHIFICPLQPARHYIPDDDLHLPELSKLPTNDGYTPPKYSYSPSWPRHSVQAPQVS
jgi:hypothetical protein